MGVIHFSRLSFWSSSILVVFHFGLHPLFESKTCFDVLTTQSNAGEKWGLRSIHYTVLLFCSLLYLTVTCFSCEKVFTFNLAMNKHVRNKHGKSVNKTGVLC